MARASLTRPSANPSFRIVSAAPDSSVLSGNYVNLASLQGTWSEGLLTLMYHAIEAPPLGYRLRYLYVDPRKLRSQIRELQQAGADFVSAAQWRPRADGRRSVLITLDDGFQNVVRNALPVFRELGVPAITYIVAGQLGGTNAWDHGKGLQERPLMTRDEILEWVGAGFEIGSHTMTHPALANIPPAQARAEIFDSKKILEDVTGRAVRHFCYPFGSWNPAVRDLVIEAGYETACTVQPGYNFADTDPFLLNRFTARHLRPYLAALLGALRPGA